MSQMQCPTKNKLDLRSFKAFLKMPITKDFLELLTMKAQSVVSGANTTVKKLVSPPLTPSCTNNPPVPKLNSFVRNLIIRSRVQPATLFGTMVYLERLKSRFSTIVAKHECAAHRILLASLIVAGKFLNDSSPKNKHWSAYSQIFQIPDVNLMEKQMLQYLKFNLTISEEELLLQYSYFAHLPHTHQELALVTPIATYQPTTPKSGVFPTSGKTPLSSRFPEYFDSSPKKIYKKGQFLTPIVMSNTHGGGIPYPSPEHRIDSQKSINPNLDELQLSYPSKNSSLYQRRISRKQRRASVQINMPLTRIPEISFKPASMLIPPVFQFSNGPLSAPLGKQFPDFSPGYSAGTTPSFILPPSKESQYNIISQDFDHHLTLPPLHSIVENLPQPPATNMIPLMYPSIHYPSSH